MKHPATAERAVAVLGRMRRRCNHPKTEQGRGRMARARPGTGGAEAPPHLQKGLTRGSRELRRAGRDTEGRDYLILITLIILIRGRRVGGRRMAGEALRNGTKGCCGVGEDAGEATTQRQSRSAGEALHGRS